MGEKTALLECISNLAANEMFSGETPIAAEAVTEKIVEGIRRLKGQLAHLVIVSNNVFEDGIAYDETTMEYIRAMGQINEKLAAMTMYSSGFKTRRRCLILPYILRRQTSGRPALRAETPIGANMPHAFTANMRCFIGRFQSTVRSQFWAIWPGARKHIGLSRPLRTNTMS